MVKRTPMTLRGAERLRQELKQLKSLQYLDLHGTEVTAADKETVESQARRREIKVWVFNSQNVTPDVQRVTQTATSQNIRVATITETLAPQNASFEQWQVKQLEGLQRALHLATGR